MNLRETQIEALRIFGYTREEARFLCLVATHSGYFVIRQFLGFTGASRGKRTTSFWSRLETNRHARKYRLAQGGMVFHLSSERIYLQIGHENFSNCRGHELPYIRTRIAMLDFVLGNPDLEYLQTEPDKVAYFLKELSVGSSQLPSKSYGGGPAGAPIVRYFVDRYPMFLAPGQQQTPVITFTYVQGAQANLVGLAHHLKTYLPLFEELSRFGFIFLARSEAHFARARELFRELVRIPLESNPSQDLLRYFGIRKAWDLGQYGALTEEDLIFRNLARERFRGPRLEHFYRAWKAGRISDGELRAEFPGSDKPHDARFETQILGAIGAGKKSSEVQSEGGHHANRQESPSHSQSGNTDGGTGQYASR